MDVLDFFRYFAALLLVLGLIGAAGLATRKFGVPGLVRPNAIKRLHIVESLILSPRQRLTLVRRDGVEHLLMITPTGATVIETGITPPPPPARPISTPPSPPSSAAAPVSESATAPAPVDAAVEPPPPDTQV